MTRLSTARHYSRSQDERRTQDSPQSKHSTEDEKDRIARERFGRPYDELSTNEKRSVAGTIGGEHRKERMSEAKGGDTHAAYSELGQKGGRATGTGGAEERE